MTRQILKFMLAHLPVMLVFNTCFGQFQEINPREGRLKGKVDSVTYTNYNIHKNTDGEEREFNDKSTYVYNEKGHLVEELASDEEGPGQDIFRIAYTYDAEGHRIQALDFGKKNVLRSKSSYTFDPGKRLVQVNEAGMVTSKMRSDKAGNVIENVIYHHSPQPFSTFRFRYNGKGLCTESLQTWSKSDALSRISYTYDASGNLIKEMVYNNSKLLCTYTYKYTKYDKMQNWLLQYTYKNGNLDGVTERSIHYQ